MTTVYIVVAAVVGIGGTVYTVLGSAGPNVAGPAPPTAAAPTWASPAPSVDGESLGNVNAVAGVGSLAGLPEPLKDEDRYTGAVVIACPSNQTGDQSSEVIYETRERYRLLTGTLLAYREPADGVLMELEVFSDPADRRPGVPQGGTLETVRLRAGEEQPVSVEIGAAYYLRLRVMCEKPGGFFVLGDARLWQAP